VARDVTPTTSTSAARLADAVLEASVVGSFTRIGYQARRRLFAWSPLETLSFTGKNVVVTGATSGIGRVAAEIMACGGARVCVVGRDLDRTERARAEIEAASRAAVEAELADLSSMSQSAVLAERYADGHDSLDILVLNAGALLHDFTPTAEGNETTLAVHVLSPFLLISAFRALLELAAGRVILVSSGGMYAQALDVAALDPAPVDYDGTKAYARCKRAQVVLAEEWTRRLLGTGVTVNAMHPGWADTRALRDSLPGFSRMLGPLLRTPEEGADTIVWLAGAAEVAGTSGEFFLDREARTKHRLARTHGPGQALEAARLWQLCLERTS
jgi:dehydrogenase/reductase SDR family member 12